MVNGAGHLTHRSIFDLPPACLQMKLATVERFSQVKEKEVEDYIQIQKALREMYRKAYTGMAPPC